MLDGDAGEVRDFLAQPGEPVEEGGLTAVGGADDGHEPVARSGRAGNYRSATGDVAGAHETSAARW